MRRAVQRVVLVLIAAGAGALLLSACRPVGPPPLHLTVDAAADTTDASVGDGICDDGTGHCSLRAAVQEVNASPSSGMSTVALAVDPVLTIAPAGSDDVTTGDLDVTGKLHVVGGGHRVQGQNGDRVLHQRSGDLVLSDLLLLGGVATGSDPRGGGILAESNLVVIDSRILQNRATGGGASGGAIFGTSTSNVVLSGTGIENNSVTSVWLGGMRGGGLVSEGRLSLSDTTVTGSRMANQLTGDYGTGGGIWFGGSTLTVRSSTVASNMAMGAGSAIAVVSGSASLADTTITGNQNGVGPGVLLVLGTADLVGVTIADNAAAPAIRGTGITVRGSLLATRLGPVCVDPITSGGYNLAVDSSCGLGATGDRQDGVTGLLPLGANGGPTSTRMPFAGLRAVDAIPVGTPGLCDASRPVDQRGSARPAGGGCDVGAVEGSAAIGPALALAVTSAADSHDAVPGDGICADAAAQCTVRAAVEEANAYPTPDSVTVPSGLVPAPLTLGALLVNERLDLHGNSAHLDGNRASGVLNHQAGRLDIDRLTMQGGAGAGMVSAGDLVVTRLVSGGLGAGVGNTGAGLVYVGRGTLEVHQSTMVGNAAGGLVIGPGGRATITDSAFYGNRLPINAGPNDLPVRGGPGLLSSASVSVVNSTFTENQAGAILADGGHIDLRATTVSGNEVGASVRALGGTITVQGSILDPLSGAACEGAVTSAGWNIATDPSCSFDQPSDRVVDDARLAPRANNGGPTNTLLPYADSPVVGAIPLGTAGLCDGSLPTDQRGVARPAGAACDVGAAEGDTGTSPAPLSLVVDVAGDARDNAPGNGSCDDGTGHCPLRAAIDEANAHAGGTDLITIAAGIDPVLSRPGTNENLNAVGDLDVSGRLVIEGGGATVDGNQLDGVLQLASGRLTLRDLTLTNGSSTALFANGDLAVERVTLSRSTGLGAGGLQMNKGTDLQMSDSFVTGNSTQYGTGGIVIGGTGAIERTTVANNSSVSGTGGIQTGLLGDPAGLVTIRDTTVDSNAGRSGDYYGGGPSAGVSAGGPTWVVASTVTRNGGSAFGVSRYGSLDLMGTVAEVDLGAVCTAPDNGGTVHSSGWNVFSDQRCPLDGPGDLGNRKPLLGSLEDNGGPTPTRLPFADSPTVDRIPVGTPELCEAGAVDQRGQARPVGAGCDVGAVEGHGPTTPVLDLTVDTPADSIDATPDDGICADTLGRCSLRAAVQESNRAPADDHITIGAGIDPVLSLAGQDDGAAVGDLDLLDPVTIDGGGAVVDGGHVDRVFEVWAPATITDVTITGGSRVGGYELGGGIRSQADLTLDGVHLVGNTIEGHGGGLAQNFGHLTVRDSTISDNHALSNGGGLYLTTADATVITDSTLSDNGASQWGGAIFSLGDLTLARSTISGNTAPYGAATYDYDDFGPGALVRLAGSTITGNTSTAGENIIARTKRSVDLDIVGTTIAGNSGPTFLVDPGGARIAGSILGAVSSGPVCSDQVVSNGWNLVADSSCFAGTASDHVGVDALLGPLADNGGPTPTLLPGLTSPAIDAIPIGTPFLCDSSSPTDQRGVVRPQGSACDIGSVER